MANTYTTNKMSYYGAPGSPQTMNPIAKSPNPPGVFPMPYQKIQIQQSSSNSSLFTAILTIGLILLCGGIFVIIGGRIGPFESSSIKAPIIKPVSQYTNQSNVIINGSAKENSTIEIYANGKKVVETLSDGDGKFAGQFKVEDEKTYSVNAVVIKNMLVKYRSPYSNTVEFVYDKTAPVVTLNKPKDPINVSDYSITGKVTERAKITIDIKGIKTENNTGTDGSFSIPIKVTSGATEISVTAIDLAGNSSQTQKLTVTYIIPSITTSAKTTAPMTATASTLPNSSGTFDILFGNYMILVFTMLALLTYAASYSAMWLVKNIRS